MIILPITITVVLLSIVTGILCTATFTDTD